MDQLEISQLIVVFAVLSVVVNIVTEVTKNFISFGSDVLINLFVTVISIILSVFAFTVYWQISGLTFAWYLIPAFVIIGFLVAYAAMFGYDKLIKKFSEVIDLISE